MYFEMIRTQARVRAWRQSDSYGVHQWSVDRSVRWVNRCKLDFPINCSWAHGPDGKRTNRAEEHGLRSRCRRGCGALPAIVENWWRSNRFA